jgi:hypothetical protein
MTLLAPDVSRLGKICSLFSSNHTGERAAAAFKADQIVRAAGLTWPDVIGGAALSKPTGEWPASYITPAEILAKRDIFLTDWEKGFLKSLCRRHGPMTLRQKQVFDEIRHRVIGAAR